MAETSLKPNAKREKYLDIAKGLGIFLVVMGHSIPDASTPAGISDPYFVILFGLIYSFHMPLFFFISGLLTRPITISTDKASFKFGVLKKLFNRLLVPYFFVGLCYLPFKLLLSSFANKPYDLENLWKIFLGLNPDGELWFLYALFMVKCIALMFDNRVNMPALALSLILAVVDIKFSLLPCNILWYLFFLLAGMYMRNNHQDWIVNTTFTKTVAYLLIFIISNYMLIHMSIIEWKLLTSLSGTLLFLNIALMMSKTDNMLTNVFELLGLLSMDIYILSDIIKIPLRIVFWNHLHWYNATFCICTLFSIIISYLITRFVIRKSSFLKRAIIGLEK